MLRILARLTGLLVLAAGFAALVVDGTRSIAGSELSLTPIADILRPKLPELQALALKVHPLLWDPVALVALRAPLWLVLATIRLFLMWISQRRAPGVGTLTRS